MMKNYKRLIIYLIPLFILSSCIVDDLEERTSGEILASLSAPSDDAFFLGITTSITIELTFSENPGAAISSVNVTKTLTTGGNQASVTFSVSGSTVTQTATELFADVPINGVVLTENDLTPGDTWVFSYTFIVNGRELASGDKTTITFTCLSDLAGTHTYSTIPWCNAAVTQTGTSIWVAEGAGFYSITGQDYAFGAYTPCYGAGAGLPEGTLLLLDICNTLSWTGASQWGEIYTFNSISVSGADMVLNWENDYGEAGITTLTREGGVNWPAITK